jgi:thioredoxin 1
MALVAAGIVMTHGRYAPQSGCDCGSIFFMGAYAAEAAQAAGTNATAKAALPRLVDLGADKCIPCKMMAPVLKELKQEYDGRMVVEFIDVWKNPDAGKAYQINLIPTQIFFDPTGKEVFRHEGFFSKKDILARWKELGVDLKSEGSAKSASRSPNGKEK